MYVQHATVRKSRKEIFPVKKKKRKRKKDEERAKENEKPVRAQST